ncbi:MAG: hypothetical protein R2716_01835 [Microthrixaceae bacterium]
MRLAESGEPWDPGVIEAEVGAGDPLDEAVLGSYVVGAAHMAASMVCSEGIAVDAAGVPEDLTIRSFGISALRRCPGSR